jgi:GTPase involved in cell partitioning and DNA repair
MRSALRVAQSLVEQQRQEKETTAGPIQRGGAPGREGEMIQALQTTLQILHNERLHQADTARQGQLGQGKKGDKESTSPVEIKSPKTRRRKSIKTG